MPNFLPYWLAAHHIRAIPSTKWMAYAKTLETIEQLFQADDATLINAGLPEIEIQLLRQIGKDQIQKDLDWMNEKQTIVSIDDDRYPSLLKQIPTPPLVLYVRGNAWSLSQMQIAIVGSRKASHYGLLNAAQFASSLSKTGFVITSGLAIGIDAACHKSAMEANGITIGVAGTGLNQIYPRAHRDLLKSIVDHNGAIISEFPLETPPYASNFPRRNRIIAGLSLGVLVVEAAIKSGSLITARLAAEFGRDVFAIPGSIHHVLSRGCHFLISQGAKLVEDVQDILTEFSMSPHQLQLILPQAATPKTMTDDHLSKEERGLLAHIGYEITPMDMIISLSHLTESDVSSILLQLELQKLIQSVPGGYIRLTVR